MQADGDNEGMSLVQNQNVDLNTTQNSDDSGEEVSQEILNTTQTICDLLSAMGTVTDAQRQSILRSLKRITVRIFVSAHSL